MNTPVARGLLASLFVVAVCLAIWWFWTGGNNPASLGEAPTRELDLLESRGALNFHLPRLDGSEFELSSVHDKLVIVNFWASWCDPCVKEFPSMLKLVDQFKGRLLLVAVSADEKKEDAEKFVKAFAARGPGIEILWDPNYRVAHEFGTKKLPESYLLTREHHLNRKVVGLENWVTDDVVEYLQLLDSKTP
jgi:thiol-disulfide isomerase/thioredoxin